MSKKKCFKYYRILGIILPLAYLMGCGQNPAVDRLEPLNRSIYSFNKGLDRVLIKPVTRAYDGIIPTPIQRMVSNFFQNLREIPNIANDFLQGDLHYAGYDTGRFLVNSTWGLGGLFDVASRGGLKPHVEDFGLTLAKWGYKDSSYFVIPILGPSTLRDTVGVVGTYYMTVVPYFESVALRNSFIGLYYIETRAALLKADPLIGESVDEYVFIRDAYLQHRQYQINGEKEESTTDINLEEPPE